MMEIPERRRKVCANCKNSYREGDKYCRYCGAPLGKPDFIEEDFACIYGPPPVERTHKCEKCGFSWKTTLMMNSGARNAAVLLRQRAVSDAGR